MRSSWSRLNIFSGDKQWRRKWVTRHARICSHFAETACRRVYSASGLMNDTYIRSAAKGPLEVRKEYLRYLVGADKPCFYRACGGPLSYGELLGHSQSGRLGQAKQLLIDLKAPEMTDPEHRNRCFGSEREQPSEQQ